jgi:hypothetical protein
MLMIDMEPEQAVVLPMPDGRQIRIEGSPEQADPQRSVTITIPALKATDQIMLIVAGRRHSILGAPPKSSRTRIALNLPDDCRVRFSNRDRKPRKEKAVNA